MAFHSVLLRYFPCHHPTALFRRRGSQETRIEYNAGIYVSEFTEAQSCNMVWPELTSTIKYSTPVLRAPHSVYKLGVARWQAGGAHGEHAIPA